MGSVNISSAELGAYIRENDGPVMRHLIMVGEQVKQRTIAGLRPGFPRDFLAPSIVKRISAGESGPKVTVTATQVKTRPHQIVGNPLLVFFWKKAGRVVYLRHVNHPGSDFSAYVERKLREALESTRV